MRHTQKTPKKTMRNAEVNTFLHSAARRLGHFFAIKHSKNRCESRSKVQFWVRKVPKLEFQHMPAKESHHPARRQTQRLPTTTTPKTKSQQLEIRTRAPLCLPAQNRSTAHTERLHTYFVCRHTQHVFAYIYIGTYLSIYIYACVYISPYQHNKSQERQASARGPRRRRREARRRRPDTGGRWTRSLVPRDSKKPFI